MQNLTFAFFRWLISAVIFRRQIDIYRFDKHSDQFFLLEVQRAVTLSVKSATSYFIRKIKGLLCHQAAEAFGDAVKSLLETGARAGNVDAHEAVETVHHT